MFIVCSIMKRVNIILAVLFLSLFTAELQAQRVRHSLSESPYKPWASFAGDTARYLEFNYNIRSVQYVGWTVGELLDELELPVIGIVSWMGRGGQLVMITLGIHQKGDVHSQLRDYYINVGFENPPTFEEFRRVSQLSAGVSATRALTPELYSFIKNLRISGVSTNEWILRDPELIEERRRMFGEYDRQGREARNERLRQERARE